MYKRILNVVADYFKSIKFSIKFNHHLFSNANKSAANTFKILKKG